MKIAEQKKLIALVNSRINLIYTNSEKVAKMFKSNSVAIKGFESIVEELKVKDKGEPILVALNKVFDTIIHASYKFVEAHSENRVPLEYVKILVDKATEETKKAFK